VKKKKNGMRLFFYLKSSRAVKNDTARFALSFVLPVHRPSQADFQTLAPHWSANLFGTQDFSFPPRKYLYISELPLPNSVWLVAAEKIKVSHPLPNFTFL
jgi:hypothetical protein